MTAATTKAKHAKADSKPKQDFNAIGQLGLKAQGLAIRYKVEIGNRLGAAFLMSFGSDITALTAAVPAVITTHDGAIQLTAAQSSALDDGHKLVMGLRTTVKGHQPDKDVLLAYGVGTATNKHLVKEVKASLQKIHARVKGQPAEAQSFDIVHEDVDAIVAAIKKIDDADEAQEAGRAAAPQTTKERNVTARRILAGIKKIAGAGMRAFVSDKTVYANFEGLVKKAP